MFEYNQNEKYIFKNILRNAKLRHVEYFVKLCGNMHLIP